MIDTKRVRAAEIRETILSIAQARLTAGGGKVDPMEVAIAIAGKDETVWRRLMKPIKDEVARLAEAGSIVVIRKKKTVDPKKIRGLYRFRMLAPGEEKPVYEEADGDGDLDLDEDDFLLDDDED